MKIKKMFSLVSIASLALLMTACSSSKNDGILDTDTFAVDAITLEDYKNEVKVKKEVVKVFEGLTVSQNNGNSERGIVIAYDDDKYYVYNMLLDNPKVLEFDRADVTTIKYYYSNNSDYLYVAFKADDDGNTGYAYYTADGRTILDKIYLESKPTVSLEDEFDIRTGLIMSSLEAKQYKLTYQTKNADDETITNKIFYYSTKDESKDVTEYKYYLNDEFDAEYKNLEDTRYDGSVIGLKGYTIQISESTLYIFKKDNLVNVLTLANGQITSNGYTLFQVITEVGINDKYDIYYGGKYMTVKTYKICLANSKMTEVKDFHYYLKNDIDEVYSQDEDGNLKELKGTLYKVFDFKEKKAVVDSDAKVALIKGNGSIEVNKKLIQDGTNDVIMDDKYYYSYNDDKTVVSDKNGKVINVYDGYYFEGVKIVKSYSYDGSIAGYNFFDKDGKKVLYLTDVAEYAYNRYTGKNLFGEKTIVIIDNGVIKTANIDDYTAVEDEFIVKMDLTENYCTFYTCDDTLTKLDLEFDADDYAFGYAGTYGNKIMYSLANNDDDTVTVFYFK